MLRSELTGRWLLWNFRKLTDLSHVHPLAKVGHRACLPLPLPARPHRIKPAACLSNVSGRI